MKFRFKSNENRKNFFHSQDISSIENNLDSIIYEKMDSILNQQRQREKNLKSLKTIKSFTTRKNNDNKYNHLNKRRQEIINKRITLGQLLMKDEKKREINNIINQNNYNSNQNRNNINIIKDNIIKNEIINGRDKKEKKEDSTFFRRKLIERKKSIDTIRINIENNNNFKIYVNKSDKITVKRKVGRRYTLFKTILNYLESNNITLDELLRHNPFQSIPYELSNSYDFILAVKFKNYEYVTEALHSSNKYLFSFDYFGQTGYHWAAKLGDLKMLKLLLEFGLYHNQKDFKGRTPLYLAALNNHKEICNFLLINNGNIYLKDKKGLGPADIAGSKELKYYLVEYMSQPFSNPIYKARIQAFLKEREERIKLKRKKQEEERIKKEKEKEQNNNN